MKYLLLLAIIASISMSSTPPPWDFGKVIDIKYKLPKILIKDSALLSVIDSVILTDTCPDQYNPKYNLYIWIDKYPNDSIIKLGFELRDFPLDTEDKMGYFNRKGVNFIIDNSFNDSIYQKTNQYKTFYYKGPYAAQNELTSWYFIKKEKKYILESKYCIPFHY